MDSYRAATDSHQPSTVPTPATSACMPCVWSDWSCLPACLKTYLAMWFAIVYSRPLFDLLFQVVMIFPLFGVSVLLIPTLVAGSTSAQRQSV